MKAKRTHSEKLSTEKRKALEDSDFGIPETREFPLTDAAHIRAAESYFHYAPDDKKTLLAQRILAKAKKFGVNVESQKIWEWAEK
jgi:hypothetical protein